MKCPSIYNFYRTYFGIPSSGKLQFALAIKESEKQLSEVFLRRDRLGYESNSVILTKDVLGTKVPLEIPFTFCYDKQDERMIFLEYGRLETVHLRQTVFKTLTSEYNLKFFLPKIAKVAYWDLLKGDTRDFVYGDIEYAPTALVNAAARKYINIRHK